MDPMKRIQELITQINMHNTKYYTWDQPEISDEQYDRLYDELVQLEQSTGLLLPHSPTQRIGAEVASSFQPHEHLAPLWSLDKAQTEKQLRNWHERVLKMVKEYNDAYPSNCLPIPTYVVEYKFDGLTLNLTYTDGKLIQAATRGNGKIGEAILSQAKTIKSIPLTIPFAKGTLEVQGEAIMNLSTLRRYNETADVPLKNARNAAAGALRNLNPQTTAQRELNAYMYNIGHVTNVSFENDAEMKRFLKENGFNVNSFTSYCYEIDEVIQQMHHVQSKRDQLDYLIDGAVLKVTDMRTREAIGYTDKFPRWAIAYKFKVEHTVTKLLSVHWNVGRTGKVTPLASVEPVQLAGVTVQNCTLNNPGDIKRKNLKFALGTNIHIRRSNDVIPEILGKETEDHDGTEIVFPDHCPSCKFPVQQIGAHLYCTNKLGCKPQIIARIVHFASRDAMDIEAFSEKTALQLYEQLQVKDPADLYRLDSKDLIELERFGKKKASNLIAALERSKKKDVASFLYALGIPHTGKSTTRMLAEHYDDVETLMQATIPDLLQLPDIGEVVAHSIVTFFADPRVKSIIQRLFTGGVRPQKIEKHTVIGDINNFFSQKIVVLTGTFSRITRQQASIKLKSLGAKVTGSVSSQTDIVIAGENPGSKLIKAQALGVTIMKDEDQFLRLLQEERL